MTALLRYFFYIQHNCMRKIEKKTDYSSHKAHYKVYLGQGRIHDLSEWARFIKEQKIHICESKDATQVKYFFDLKVKMND